MRRKPTDEDIAQYLHRITSLEKHLVLPARIALILSCVLVLWQIIALDLGVQQLAALLRWAIAIYALLNLLYWLYLFRFAQKPRGTSLTKGIVFASALTDNAFLGVLLYAVMMKPFGQARLGAGPEASLFWVYCALLVRNVFLFPRPAVQALVNLLYIAGYVTAILVSTMVPYGPELVSRAIILTLLSICGSVIYALRQRQLRQLDEAHEKSIRSLRLDLAGMLAAQVAHELKNPLSIMTNAAFLLRKSKRSLEPSVSQQLDIIQEEIQRADKIITELLDYAKLAEGRIEGILVNDTMDECLSGLKHDLQSRRISLKLNYSLDLPFLFIDPGQLRQIFTNILLNACEATDDGGTIAVTTSYQTNGFIEVSIADTGRGMPPDVLGNIFKPFFTTKEKGTGMGLSIVQNVVRAYKGEIRTESQEGIGTTFHLHFPTRMALPTEEKKSFSSTRDPGLDLPPARAKA